MLRSEVTVQVRAAAFVGAILLVALGVFQTGSAEPKSTQPPALAPYAEHDPLPKLGLKPYPNQNTATQVVESFLAFLSLGDNSGDAPTGGTIPGYRDGYEQAWRLMTDERLSLTEFKDRWLSTVRLGVVQLEPTSSGNTFFVELERLEYCRDHWAISYYVGSITAMETPHGWRISSFAVSPENLVRSNIGGHQGWAHNVESVVTTSLTPSGDWELQTVSYDRRTATVSAKNKKSGIAKTVRLARTVEGSWRILSMTP